MIIITYTTYIITDLCICTLVYNHWTGTGLGLDVLYLLMVGALKLAKYRLHRTKCAYALCHLARVCEGKWLHFQMQPYR